MTAAEEFSELRDWFAQWKRDNPFSFWTAIVLPWLFAMGTVGLPAAFVTAFPFADAENSVRQILQRSDVGTFHYKIVCKIPQGTYLFGYELTVATDGAFGRACRDIVRGSWVFSTK